MSRELFSPNNGQSITSNIPSASGGTGVKTIAEVISKFSLVPRTSIGQIGGPAPKKSTGEVDRDYVPGTGSNPYGIQLPTQVSNKVQSIFTASFLDTFTNYNVTVSRGSVSIVNGDILYVPEPGYVGAVDLIINDCKSTFQVVSKVLSTLMVLDAVKSSFADLTYYTFKYVEPSYTDGSAVGTYTMALTGLFKGSTSVAMTGFTLTADPNRKELVITLTGSISDEAIDSANVSITDSSGNVQTVRLKLPQTFKQGIYLDFVTGPDWDGMSVSNGSKVVTVAKGARQGPHVPDTSIISASGNVEIYRYYPNTEKIRLVQTIVPPPGTKQEMNAAMASPDGEYVLVSSKRAFDGNVRGGFLDVYKYSEKYDVYQYQRRLTSPLTAAYPNGGMFGVSIAWLGGSEILVSSYATSSDNTLVQWTVMDFLTGETLAIVPLHGGLKSGYGGGNLWNDFLIVQGIYGATAGQSGTGSLRIWKRTGRTTFTLNLSKNDSRGYAHHASLLTGIDAVPAIFIQGDAAIGRANNGYEFLYFSGGNALTEFKNMNVLFPGYPTATWVNGNRVTDGRPGVFIMFFMNSSYVNIDWSVFQLDPATRTFIDLGKEKSYQDLLAVQKKFWPAIVSPYGQQQPDNSHVMIVNNQAAHM